MDNKTKEKILKQEATEACLTPTQMQLVLSAMESYFNQKKNHFAEVANKKMKQAFNEGVFWRERYCSQEDESEFDYKEKIRQRRDDWMKENGITTESMEVHTQQSTKQLQDRIDQMTEALKWCQKLVDNMPDELYVKIEKLLNTKS